MKKRKLKRRPHGRPHRPTTAKTVGHGQTQEDQTDRAQRRALLWNQMLAHGISVYEAANQMVVRLGGADFGKSEKYRSPELVLADLKERVQNTPVHPRKKRRLLRAIAFATETTRNIHRLFRTCTGLTEAMRRFDLIEKTAVDAAFAHHLLWDAYLWFEDSIVELRFSGPQDSRGATTGTDE